MDKIWFIEIKGKREGPYSFQQLKRDWRITPDTLAWKEGLPKWVKVRHIPELKKLFEDETPQETKHPQENPKEVKPSGEEELAIDLRRNPPPIVFWLLVAAILISYIIYIILQDQ